MAFHTHFLMSLWYIRTHKSFSHPIQVGKIWNLAIITLETEEAQDALKVGERQSKI